MSKENVVTCDLCHGQMWDDGDHSGHSLHIKKGVTVSIVWWWMRQPSSENKDLDICSRCYNFIHALLTDRLEGLRQIYEMWLRMCPADMERFEDELKELAKETDRYYENHPLKEEVETENE